MIVLYRTRGLKRASEDVSEAIRRWGPQAGPRYVQRVQVLATLPRWADVFTIRSWRTHPLKGAKRGRHAIDLTRGAWRMEVAADPDGTAVMIEEVNNHYGD